ncbi:hypothetical protein PPERSA_00933 [Pseudocohnilembus persalinus]|uniref:Uncharacterized protein n=1 Tax=Pseudocohnilembus persalinus TaxID=266149 RepID=A0A0V0QES2_PSEPJ|nr:hypothetical protein PPERSA_00933 [Pseudocohnilembus persalinus]|eukprot:KRX00706.1 hypothetical protein PPERSA_00933 [Pseudocohnilembus persalinus]
MILFENFNKNDYIDNRYQPLKIFDRDSDANFETDNWEFENPFTFNYDAYENKKHEKEIKQLKKSVILVDEQTNQTFSLPNLQFNFQKFTNEININVSQIFEGISQQIGFDLSKFCLCIKDPKTEYYTQIQDNQACLINFKALEYLPQIEIKVGQAIQEEVLEKNENVNKQNTYLQTQTENDLIYQNQSLQKQKQSENITKLIQDQSQSETTKQKRVRERSIIEVIEKVQQWRNLFENGIPSEKDSNQMIRITLHQAAAMVNLSKKSLDNYHLQLKNGYKYGFNFELYKHSKIGKLRQFNIQKKKEEKKQQQQNQCFEECQNTKQSSDFITQIQNDIQNQDDSNQSLDSQYLHQDNQTNQNNETQQESSFFQEQNNNNYQEEDNGSNQLEAFINQSINLFGSDREEQNQSNQNQFNQIELNSSIQLQENEESLVQNQMEFNKITTADNQDPEIVDTDVFLLEQEKQKQSPAKKHPNNKKQNKESIINIQGNLQALLLSKIFAIKQILIELFFQILLKDENFDLDYYKYQEDNKINFERKKKELDRIQPRKSVIIHKDNQPVKQYVRYSLKDICCRAKTGYNCCGRTSKDSIFNSYGGNDRYKSDLTQFLYDTSIGPAGLSTLECSLSETLFIDGNFSETEELTSLKCSAGFLEMEETYISQFYLSNEETITCGNVYETQVQSDINNNSCGDSTWGAILNQIMLDKDCREKDECSITNSEFKDYFADCWSDLKNQNDLQFRISSQCSDAQFELFDEFGASTKISIESIANFIAIMDVVIVVLFIQMLMALSISDNKTQNNVFKDRVQVSKFSVMISNLPVLQENELKLQLKQHIELRIQKYLDKKKKTKKDIKIVDIRIAEAFEEIQLMQKEGINEQQKQEKVAEFIHKYDKNLNIIKQLIPGKVRLQDLNDAIPNFPKKKQNEAKKDLQKIEKLKKKVLKINNKVKRNEENAYEVKYAFVTFETMHSTGVALQALRGNSCQQLADFLCGCCVSQNRKFKGKLLKIKQAPAPDNILWENIYISSIAKFIRRFISILLTIIFLVGSFWAIIYVRNKTDEIKEQYPEVNCSEVKYDNIKSSDIINESEQNSGAGFIQCFCNDKIQDIIKYTANKSGYFKDKKEIYEVCYDWFQDYAFIQLLPLIAAICVIEVNFFIQLLFRKLSSFEKYNYLTQEYAARIYKIFIAMFINTGLLLLIINVDFKISNDNFLHSVLGGQYQDLTPSWFKNVGTVIIFTIAVNTISTPLVMMGFQLIRVTLRCLDRGCTYNGKKTNKRKTQQLIDLYTGPEFMIDLRYSQILNVIFIGMVYSAGLPLLYFCVFLHLFLLFWFDKIWVLKICRIPKNYDEEMQNIVKKIIWIAPILHLIFAIFIYGNFQIFYESQTFIDEFSTFSDSKYLQIFIERAVSRKYNIYLAILLLFILMVIILRIFVWTPIKHIFKRCCKTAYHKQNVKNPRRDQSYYNFMSSEMIDQDIKLSEYYMEENVNNLQFYTLMEKRQKELHAYENIVSSQKHSIDFPNFLGLFSYDIRWLYRATRNRLPRGAQVRILQASL